MLLVVGHCSLLSVGLRCAMVVVRRLSFVVGGIGVCGVLFDVDCCVWIVACWLLLNVVFFFVF